jgi:hypothetical protein
MTNEERRLTTSDIAASDTRRVEVEDRARAERVEAGGRAAIDERPTPLFGDEELSGYRTRWSAIQTGFVDEPRKAVEEADTLVAELMKRLAEGFAHERNQLEAHWERSDQVSTEDLRIAMRRYRSFFERLLAV